MCRLHSTFNAFEGFCSWFQTAATSEPILQPATIWAVASGDDMYRLSWLWPLACSFCIQRAEGRGQSEQTFTVWHRLGKVGFLCREHCFDHILTSKIHYVKVIDTGNERSRIAMYISVATSVSVETSKIFIDYSTRFHLKGLVRNLGRCIRPKNRTSW